MNKRDTFGLKPAFEGAPTSRSAHHYTSIQLFAVFWPYLKPHRGRIALAILALMLFVGVPLGMGRGLAYLVMRTNTDNNDIDKIISNRGDKSSIGFEAEVKDKSEKEIGHILKKLETEDLLKFGLIPEFVGRLPVIATLDDLNEESLIEILTKPKNALIKQYQKLFAFENVKLEFTDDALNLIAKKAIERTTGARGLRSILENILLDTMYNLPGVEGVNEIVVNTEVIENNSKPLYIYDKPNKIINKKA